MLKPEKFLVIVERTNEPLFTALTTAYAEPKYLVVADRRHAHRRRSSRSGHVNERRHRRADVSPFAIVASAGEQ